MKLLPLILCALAAADSPWDAVDALLSAAVAARVTPGLAAAVRDSSGATLFWRVHGNLTYGSPAPQGPNGPTTNATLWDMASLSKLMGPTSVAAHLAQLGRYSLDEPLCSPALLGPQFAGQGKAGITSRHLLLHSAGFPPDPMPNYSSPAFACPGSALPSPPLSFSCAERVFAAVLAQPLAAPPGSVYVYSDLSMITLLYALGRAVAAQGLVTPADFRAECGAAAAAPSSGLHAVCAYEAYWRLAIKPLLFPAGLAAPTAYLLPQALWPSAAPTYADAAYRHRVMQGQVSDANAYAAGGIAGHAGLFSTLGDALAFTAAWAAPGALLNASTLRAFTSVADEGFSSRALGWDTQAPLDGYRGCGAMSNATYYHTGFTGTQVCLDPEAGVSTVLLTARVYTDMEANGLQVHALRQSFNTAVLAAIAKGKGAQAIVK